MNILELLTTIQEIGKPLKVRFKDSSLDYFIKGEPPRFYSIDYFLVLKKKYNDKLYIQLKHKPTQGFFDKVSNQIDRCITSNLEERENQFLSYGFIKAKGQLTESNHASHNDIVAILNAQYNTLEMMKTQLVVFAELADFIIDSDFSKNKKPSLPEGSGIIDYPPIGKATFNFTKKEAMMFIFILEETGLLSFEKDTRNKFIENNFCYTEKRKTPLEGTSVSMRDVNSDIANLRASHLAVDNNKTLRSLKEVLENTLFNFTFDKKK